MGISYRKDDDLAFLQYCSEDDIKQLATFIIYDKDGVEHFTSEIRASAEFKELEGKPDQWRKSWRLIAGELQHFGGDTLVNLFRQNGVLYREILGDVCDKISIKFDKEGTTYDIESALVEKLVKASWEKMSRQEREETINSFNFVDGASSALDSIIKAIWGKGAGTLAVSAWLASSAGMVFAPLSVVGIGGAGVASFVAQRGAGALAGPLAAVLITIPMVSGAAYRVTVPAVIQIAYMRRKYELKDRF